MKPSGVYVGEGKGDMNSSGVGVRVGVCDDIGETKVSGMGEAVWVAIGQTPAPVGVGVGE
jgi:hypothetical protein